MSILAQSCIYPQISDIFNELLDYDDDSNEIYISPWEEIPEQIQTEIVGKTFVELAFYFSSNRNPMNPSLLVGHVRGERFVLNPRDGVPGEKDGQTIMQAGDGLIFLSYKRPDFNALVGEV